MTWLWAQMANSSGLWRLYVVLYGETHWPTFEWERIDRLPTLAQRERALEGLGYELVPGRCWEWTESSKVPDDPSSRAFLIAAVPVRRIQSRGVS
ncbi:MULTISPECIES: DUF6303 family protein [Streptomyces]|uniref:DUF6303 family protein n=1 Tax=Streptomyces TaxID=1883 RepID=UPI00345BFDD9